MAQPPPQVLDLVQRFDRNCDAYRSLQYNETQVRREFLDPLFKSLGWITCTKQYFGELPIRNIDFSNPAEKNHHDQIAQLAEQMLTLHQRQSAAKTPQEKTALERQIAATDIHLDSIIYALYGLTDAEIKIVEASTA